MPCRSGFNDVFPLTTLAAFHEDELEAMLCGMGESWTVEMLSDTIKFDHGWGPWPACSWARAASEQHRGLSAARGAGTRPPAPRPGTCWRSWRSWTQPTSAASCALSPARLVCRRAGWARCSPGALPVCMAGVCLRTGVWQHADMHAVLSCQPLGTAGFCMPCVSTCRQA